MMQPDGKPARNAAANKARLERSLQRDAERLRSHGWQVTPATGADWRLIAARLAARLANHAYCGQHPPGNPSPHCPFCEDRAAYGLYLRADQQP